MYRQHILDHYRNPRNYGELAEPTFSHTGQNPSCGDEIRMDVRVADDGETIEAVRFGGEGCAISMASGSLLTEALPGMTLEAVTELEREDAIDRLGIEVTPMRIPCAVLATTVVRDGVEGYLAEREA